MRLCGLERLALLTALAGGAAFAQDPNTLLDRAVAEQTAGDYTSAIRDYRSLLKLAPKSLEARANLGAALAHQAQYDQAIEQYTLALTGVPAGDEIALNLRMNLALAYYKKGDMQKARVELVALHAARPSDARIATLLGDTETRLGDPGAAVAMMEPLSAANAADLDFSYVYGSALIQQGRRREGAAIVERVAEQGHGADAYMLAGSTLLNLNEYERARADAEAALALDPKLPGLWSLVGLARDRTGAIAESEPAFREALKQNPQDFTANLYLGAILYKRRSLEEARVYLDRAIALDPESSMARYESAMLKSAQGETQAAATALERIIASDPSWLEPHVQLAALYYKLHQPELGAKERAIVEQLTAAQTDKARTPEPGATAAPSQPK